MKNCPTSQNPRDLNIGEAAIVTLHSRRIGTIRRERERLYVVNLDNGLVGSINGYSEAIAWARNEG